jgi:hypothetical protein
MPLNLLVIDHPSFERKERLSKYIKNQVRYGTKNLNFPSHILDHHAKLF